jgi:hypothetical protein
MACGLGCAETVFRVQHFTADDGQRILRRAFKDLKREVPGRAAWGIQNLRHPDAKWVVNDRTVLVNPRTCQIVEIVE